MAAVSFSQEEQELYLHVFERARSKYHMFRAHGAHMVSKKLIQIMSTLLPLRRICSGGQLSDKDLNVVGTLPQTWEHSVARSFRSLVNYRMVTVPC